MESHQEALLTALIPAVPFKQISLPQQKRDHIRIGAKAPREASDAVTSGSGII